MCSMDASLCVGQLHADSVLEKAVIGISNDRDVAFSVGGRKLKMARSSLNVGDTLCSFLLSASLVPAYHTMWA